MRFLKCLTLILFVTISCLWADTATVDTTIYLEDASYIHSTNDDTNYGSETTGKIGRAFPYYRGLFYSSYFTTLAADSVVGDTCTYCTLVVYISAEGMEAGDSLLVYPLIRSWTESEVTWNDAASGTSWGTAGAANTSTDIETGWSRVIDDGNGTGFHKWDCKDIMDSIFADVSVYGFRLSADPEGINDTVVFRSDDYAGTTSDPRILVKYERVTADVTTVDLRHSPDGVGVRHSPEGNSVRHKP
jgi:hypothetical protein